MTWLAACSEPGKDGATLQAGASGASRTTEASERPQILLVTIDTLRADALGAYGSQSGATPLLDRLAQKGVVYERAYAHNVVTLPSHASILSGLLPYEHGVRDNSGFRLSPRVDTLASILSANGYRTAAFVSAFPLARRFGLDRGFAVYEDSFVNRQSRPALLEQERSGKETVALALDWWNSGQRGEEPSFAWVHLYEPHAPYSPPSPFDERFAEAPYLGDVRAADAALAPLLEPLLTDSSRDTLVIVTSDHGEALGEHGEATHGIFAYESTLRVPLLLHRPAALEPAVVSQPVRLIDLLPTVVDAVGLQVLPNLSGRSLFSIGSGESLGPAPPIYFEALSGQLHRGWAPLFGLIDESWKYIDLPLPELYDLEGDPAEENNRAEQDESRRVRMAGRLARLVGDRRNATPLAEDRETREQLERLGYLTGGGSSKSHYTPADDPKRLIHVDVALREIATLHAGGDLHAALQKSRDLLRENPKAKMAWMMAAQIERDLGNPENAAVAMQRAVELFPTDDTAVAQLGAYLTQAGGPAEALRATDGRAQIDRPDPEVLFVRSIAFARLGRFDEASESLELAAAFEPANPMVAVHEGTIALMSGDRATARAAWERALALEANSVQAHTALAVLETEEGRFNQALSHWQIAVSLDPRESAKLLSFAQRLDASGRTDAARSLLELYVAKAPEETHAHEIAAARAFLSRTPEP